MHTSGLSYTDIAETLSINRSTVISIIRRLKHPDKEKTHYEPKPKPNKAIRKVLPDRHYHTIWDK